MSSIRVRRVDRIWYTANKKKCWCAENMIKGNGLALTQCTTDYTTVESIQFHFSQKYMCITPTTSLFPSQSIAQMAEGNIRNEILDTKFDIRCRRTKNIFCSHHQHQNENMMHVYFIDSKSKIWFPIFIYSLFIGYNVSSMQTHIYNIIEDTKYLADILRPIIVSYFRICSAFLALNTN